MTTMNNAYQERCRCLRDIKILIPKEIWKQAEEKNQTNDSWRTAIIAIEMLVNNYENL